MYLNINPTNKIRQHFLSIKTFTFLSQSCIIFDEVNIDSHGESEYTAMNHKKETFYISWPFIFSLTYDTSN